MGKKKIEITEADLCKNFIEAAIKTKEWVAYPETAGHDIVLVRAADGVQIGIEAKLVLNAKVISQALSEWSWNYGDTGPDYRAVLVPEGRCGGLASLCDRLGVTVIRCVTEGWCWPNDRFLPDLPKPGDHYRWGDERYWHDWGPNQRLTLPDYVPDAVAGSASPVTLTAWKIKAIKMAILLEYRPATRSDFKALNLDPTRWLDPWPGWLRITDEGFVPDRMPDFKSQHPRNYDEIKADKASWMPAAIPMARQQKLAV